MKMTHMHSMIQHARTQHARTHTARTHKTHHTIHTTNITSHTMYHVSYHVRCHELLVILRAHVTNTLRLFYHRMRITTKRSWSACHIHWQLQLDKQSMQEQLICRVKNPPISNFGAMHDGEKDWRTESAGKSSLGVVNGPFKTMGLATKS